MRYNAYSGRVKAYRVYQLEVKGEGTKRAPASRLKELADQEVWLKKVIKEDDSKLGPCSVYDGEGVLVYRIGTTTWYHKEEK
jgi:hypothetical protein